MQMGDDFGVRDRPQGGRPHHFVKHVFRFEQPGRVGEDELRVAPGQQSHDGLARGLRLG